MGRVFGGIVGQSEANLRSVIRTAEAIAPCVLWIDEIEKGFGGSTGSGSSDGGTSSRVFGSFLSWMQEKEKPVFVVATANGVSQLPPEFLRAGRFDSIFFVDFPDANERAAIWRIVIARYQRDPEFQDLAALAKETEGFTGAEIEGAYCEALHEAFAEGREPTSADIRTAIAATTPVSKLRKERIEALRKWARGRAREAGSDPKPTPPSQRPSRRIQSLN
jgi:SpoVK/Ycf46/Vps4 family AAA+-type ATPase